MNGNWQCVICQYSTIFVNRRTSCPPAGKNACMGDITHKNGTIGLHRWLQSSYKSANKVGAEQ